MGVKFHLFDSFISQMDAVLRHAPGNIFLKDQQGVILYCNQAMADAVDESSFDKMIGKVDRMYCNNPQDFNLMRGHDDLALNSARGVRCVETIHTPVGDIVTFQVQKKPFYHKKKLVGVWGTSIAAASLLTDDKCLAYFDSRTDQILKLTNKQKVCLWHLLQGKSVQEVAIDMNRSVRTIENHIYNIRLNNNIKSMRAALRHIRVIN